MFHTISKLNPELILTAGDNIEFVIRIFFAAFLGILIGMERSKRLKEAGMRTHCIVAMTSAVFMILSKYAFIDLAVSESSKGADPARIAAQVVSGISFLGAGIIFKHGKNTVKGLTTAAGIWATAAVGMAVGAGLYWVSVTETFLLLVFQIVLHKHQIGSDMLTEQEISVTLDIADKDDFTAFIESHECRIDKVETVRHEDRISMVLYVRAKSPVTYQEGMHFLKDHPSVTELNIDTM